MTLFGTGFPRPNPKRRGPSIYEPPQVRFTAFLVEHLPVEPAFGFGFRLRRAVGKDFNGRIVVGEDLMEV